MPNRGGNFMSDDFSVWLSWIGHALSPIAVIGTVVGWFPAIASAVALIFYLLQMYESKTCQRWLTSRRLRKIAKLKIEMARLEALELVHYPDSRIAAAVAQEIAVKVVEKAAADAKVVLQDVQK